MVGRRGRRPDPPLLRNQGFRSRQTEMRFFELAEWAEEQTGGDWGEAFRGSYPVFAEVWGLQSSRAGVTVTELREMGLLEVVQGGNQNSSGGLYRLNQVEELRAAYLAASGFGGSLSEQAEVGPDGEEEDAGPVQFGYWQIACPRHGEMWTPTGNCPTCVREGWSNG